MNKPSRWAFSSEAPHWGQAGLYFEPRPSLCPLAQGKVILDQGPSLSWEPHNPD